MPSERIFHFSLGPVQSFVAQARRTSDFWAGSFILSYLSAVAMAEVEAQDPEHHRVVFPTPDPEFLDYVRGQRRSPELGPGQGGVPNRFQAVVSEPFDPNRVVAAVRAAWFALAEEVWADLPASVRERQKTQKVWKRQIGSSLNAPDPHWQSLWVLSDDPADHHALDRRKNLRLSSPSPEPGVKCMLMGDWQELSGADRPGSEVTDFWSDLLHRLGSTSTLRDGEHLCAFALVKRRFAELFHRLDVDMPSGWTARGWWLRPATPSVTYLAAAPWLARLVIAAPEDAQSEFRQAASRLGPIDGERETKLRRIVDAKARARTDRITTVDGDLFYDARLANPNDFPDRSVAEPIRAALGELRAAASKALDDPIGEPSPFYAVVAMDGDRLGARLSDVTLQPAITQALETFTSRVPLLVDDHSGFLIYAGGDDVLALFPADDGLPASLALRQAYAAAFRSTQPWPDGVPTLSGAVVFPHVRMPLGRALEAAQDLLKRQAKMACGRDAIAAQVIARGGDRLTWSLPWDSALEGAEEDAPRLVLDALVDEMLDPDEAPFAHRFFFRLRRLFSLLNPPIDGGDPVLLPDEAIDLMVAEYLDSGIHQREGRELPALDIAHQRVTRLLDQCRPRRRAVDGEPPWVSPRLEADGAMLVKFLGRFGRTPA